MGAFLHSLSKNLFFCRDPGVFSGWVLLVDKFRIRIISGTGVALASDLRLPNLPEGEPGGDGAQRCPLRRAQLRRPSGSVWHAVGGEERGAASPLSGETLPKPAPSSHPTHGLLLPSLGRWCGEATFGNLKEGAVGRTGTSVSATAPATRSGFRAPGPKTGAGAARAGSGARRRQLGEEEGSGPPGAVPRPAS